MIFWLQILFIVLALVTSFIILVWFSGTMLPAWVYYASMPILALGGGAAISLIFQKAASIG